jgi:MFS family permease
MQNLKPSQKWLNSTVVGAGITSALGDFCYEITTVILPGFLAVLGIPAAALGIIEGIADAVASFTKIIGGYLATKTGRRKLLVLIGYALTPIGQIPIALALSWPPLLIGRVISWFGKGLRGPLRDAIVVQAVSPGMRGRALGFHRMADTIGAVLGPLLGVALLSLAHGWTWGSAAATFRFILWLSIIPGALAVVSFLILVKDPQCVPNPSLTISGAFRKIPDRFKRFLIAVVVFGVGDFSHSLLILAATTLLTSSMGIVHATQIAGMMYVLRNVVQMSAAYPVGILADRFSHKGVLIGGYFLGGITAALTGVAFYLKINDMYFISCIFVCAGLYMATQETIEPTVAASFVPKRSLEVCYGAMGTANGVTKFISSTLVGTIWTTISASLAFFSAGLLMGFGTLILILFSIKDKTNAERFPDMQ